MPRYRKDGTVIQDLGGARSGSGRKRLRYVLDRDTARMLEEVCLGEYRHRVYTRSGEIPTQEKVLVGVIQMAYVQMLRGKTVSGESMDHATND
jgi:hypothetical protein